MLGEVFLCYIFPDSDVPFETHFRPDSTHIDAWLQAQIESIPDINCFWVVHTTDIW